MIADLARFLARSTRNTLAKGNGNLVNSHDAIVGEVLIGGS
jgi:hypothetical protein